MENRESGTENRPLGRFPVSCLRFPQFLSALLKAFPVRDSLSVEDTVLLPRIRKSGIRDYGKEVEMRRTAGILGVLLLARIASAQTLYSVTSPNQGDDQLRTIDPTTAATLGSVTITLAGKTVLGGNGLAAHPTTGQLWAILKVDPGGKRVLVTINSATGVASQVGGDQPNFAALAFNAAGTLYAVTGDGGAPSETLFTINTMTGVPTQVCALGNGDDGEALAFNPIDGLLYHASGHTGNGDVIFETITSTATDPCTVANIDITNTALVDEEAQALVWWTAQGQFLWKQNHGDGPLFRVTTAGAPTLIGDLDHQAKGLAFAMSVRAAPTMHGTGLALITTALFVLGVWLARRRQPAVGA